MKRLIISLTSLVISALALTATPLNAFAGTGVTTTRLFGSDRIGTAVAVADSGWTTADTAILVSSADANLVDTLAAAPLGGKRAPILLTDNNALTDITKAELIKLGVRNVYVVGAISQSVVDQVNALPGVSATALKGSDRIGTAAAISAKLSAPAGSFVVGYNALADALLIASYAAANNYSILVANPDGTLPASETACEGATTYIIGGPTLVKDIPGAARLFGADRFATNQAVLKALTYKYDHVYLANGTDSHLVDSLVTSSLAAKTNSPIVLSDSQGDGSTAYNSINNKLSSASVVTALGGTAAVSDETLNQVSSLTEGGGVFITSAKTIYVSTSAGTVPGLPSTVTVNLSDGTASKAAVTWAGIAPSQYSAPGTFTVTGTIDNSNIQAIACVTVTSTSLISIDVTSASIINGTMTVILSKSPWSDYSNPIAKPVVTDFTVTASGEKVTPTSISTTGAVVTLTVPATTIDHPIVYDVSYKGGTPAAANIQLTDAAANNVEVGQNFNVVLTAATDGGYSWTYTTDSEAIKLVQSTNGSLADLWIVGSGTEEVFSFQATRTGSFQLHFSEKRSWMGDNSSLDHVDYTINVK